MYIAYKHFVHISLQLFSSGQVWAFKDTYVVDTEKIKRDEEEGIYKD